MHGSHYTQQILGARMATSLHQSGPLVPRFFFSGSKWDSFDCVPKKVRV